MTSEHKCCFCIVFQAFYFCVPCEWVKNTARKHKSYESAEVGQSNMGALHHVMRSLLTSRNCALHASRGLSCTSWQMRRTSVEMVAAYWRSRSTCVQTIERRRESAVVTIKQTDIVLERRRSADGGRHNGQKGWFLELSAHDLRPRGDLRPRHRSDYSKHAMRRGGELQPYRTGEAGTRQGVDVWPYERHT